MALSKAEIQRYSRQLILPSFELEGQQILKKSAVVIVGAGGLGCPVGLYLAAAGVGKIGIVDYDVVDMSNLHRQVVHSEARIGMNKADSLKTHLLSLNSAIEVVSFREPLTSANSLEVLRNYDVIVDASDNMATRYLVSDTGVLLGKPVVSGSALMWEGHLTVYNYKDGPCYRCLFPQPPAADAVTNCNDGGILGAITGVIGSLQALEVVNVLLARPCYAQKMFIWNGLTGTMKTVALRSRRADCVGCAQQSALRQGGLVDYTIFCGSGHSDGPLSFKILAEAERILPGDFSYLNADSVQVVDVRPSIQFKISSLKNSDNIPLDQLDTNAHLLDRSKTIICVCRRGNDSQLAVKKLKMLGFDAVKDVIGGINALSEFDDSLSYY